MTLSVAMYLTDPKSKHSTAIPQKQWSIPHKTRHVELPRSS